MREKSVLSLTFLIPQVNYKMALALFDLDNTLLADDSDFLWGCFLVDNGLVDKTAYDEANQRFYADYKKGTLDIFEFLAFSLKPLTQFSMEKLAELHNEFMQKHIISAMTQKGIEQIQRHRDNGDFHRYHYRDEQFCHRPHCQSISS